MCRIFAEYVDIYIYTSIEHVYVSPKAVRTRPLEGIVCVAGDQPTEHVCLVLQGIGLLA